MVASYSKRCKSSGFSLLEMVVAVAILGLSLGALYQSVAGATRIVRIDEKYAYGVELARSLLAGNAAVPQTGMSKSGETSGGFSWFVQATPIEMPEGSALQSGRLQQIEISVSWNDGDKTREVALQSVVAGMESVQ